MRTNILFAFGASCLGLVACNGDDKPGDGEPEDSDAQGDSGETGTDVALGEHEGERPWGVHLELISVEGGTGADGHLQVGDVPVVTYAVTDDDGNPFALDELYGVAFQLAGPIDHFQVAVPYTDLADVLTASVYNGDGTHTYTFAVPIPETYAPVPNDTPDLGEDDGDWGGLPLVDGTYRLASWASTQETREDGSQYYDAGNATVDLLLGAATTLETREVVSEENCEACHGPTFYAHGGSRREVQVCQTCHVAGAEDRNSPADPTTTPGADIGWGVMIHGIHAGSQTTYGVRYNGYPADPDLPGYPDYNERDYSTVVFPQWPMEAATCEACHGGAADGTQPPTRAACGACHDAVDFATGDGHEGGPQANDDACFACHTTSATEAAHADPRDDETLNPGLAVDIVGIDGGTGPAGQVQPGDTITVTFGIATRDGTPLTTAEIGSATLVISGPLDHMQETVKSTTVLADAVASGTDYVLTFLVPMVYPPQENDTEDLGVEVGDWKGLALQAGTYRVAVAAYTSMTAEDGVAWRVPASDTQDFLLGDASGLDTRDVVDPALCDGCHGTLEFHGMGRVGYEYCVTCHTAGSEDRYSGTDPTTTPGVTVEFAVMLHKIHNGSNLTQVYDINGYGSPYTTLNFNDVAFPRSDGGVQACDACHGDSAAWTVASAKVCTSCHDSPEAAAHVALDPDPATSETCDACHGLAGTNPVQTSHDWLR